MNIYLDIDGVLLVNEEHAANHADIFLQTILAKYPDSTFWLTTHNWRGENRTKTVLAPHLKQETIPLLDMIKESSWNELKTDAIDFSKDFIWFDDDLWPEELKILEENDAVEQFIMVDLNKDPDMLLKLVEIINSTAKVR